MENQIKNEKIVCQNCKKEIKEINKYEIENLFGYKKINCPNCKKTIDISIKQLETLTPSINSHIINYAINKGYNKGGFRPKK